MKTNTWGEPEGEAGEQNREAGAGKKKCKTEERRRFGGVTRKPSASRGGEMVMVRKESAPEGKKENIFKDGSGKGRVPGGRRMVAKTVRIGRRNSCIKKRE